MEKIIIEKDLPSEIILWRYMSLDKFIDLIDSSELFLSPLAFYEHTDPFEGLMPLPVKKMLLDSIIKIHNELISNYSYLKSNMHNNPEIQTKLKTIENDLINNIKTAEIKYMSMIKSTKVNCWHNNTEESEAMWKLYSQQNNGIAIKTSIDKISKSILTDELLDKIYIGRVKYINYNDTEINNDIYFIDDHFSPLIKRESYKHENEIRIFSFHSLDDGELEDIKKITAKRVKVNIETLIDEIYISPYTSEPYISSVKSICKKYNIPENKIRNSSLLSVDERLTKFIELTIPPNVYSKY